MTLSHKVPTTRLCTKGYYYCTSANLVGTGNGVGAFNASSFPRFAGEPSDWCVGPQEAQSDVFRVQVALINFTMLGCSMACESPAAKKPSSSSFVTTNARSVAG